MTMPGAAAVTRRAARRGWIALAMALAIALAGCGRSGGAGDADEDDAAAPAPATVVMAVTGARVTVAPIRRQIRMLGVTAALRQVSLRAPTSGRIYSFDLRVGDTVRRGAVVAHILSREVEAAQNGLAVAQRIDPANAAALAASVRRHSGGPGVAVIAAADGIVADRLVSDGQLVNAMDPLANLIDPRDIRVTAAAPANELASIRPGMAARVTTPIAPGVTYDARVSALAPSLAATGATEPVWLEFVGARRVVQANAPVEVTVTIAAAANATVMPRAALFADAATGAHYVFVAGTDGRAHRTPVAIGLGTEELVQALAGVKPGDTVITSGGYALSDGLRVTIAQEPQ